MFLRAPHYCIRLSPLASPFRHSCPLYLVPGQDSLPLFAPRHQQCSSLLRVVATFPCFSDSRRDPERISCASLLYIVPEDASFLFRRNLFFDRPICSGCLLKDDTPVLITAVSRINFSPFPRWGSSLPPPPRPSRQRPKLRYHIIFCAQVPRIFATGPGSRGVFSSNMSLFPPSPPFPPFP